MPVSVCCGAPRRKGCSSSLLLGGDGRQSPGSRCHTRRLWKVIAGSSCGAPVSDEVENPSRPNPTRAASIAMRRATTTPHGERATRPRKVKTCAVLILGKASRSPRRWQYLSFHAGLCANNQRFVNCRHESASARSQRHLPGCSNGFSYCVACHDWSPVLRLRLRRTTHGAPHHRLRVRRTPHWAPHRWAAPHRRLRRTKLGAPHRRLRLRPHGGVGPQGRRLPHIPHKAPNASVRT